VLLGIVRADEWLYPHPVNLDQFEAEVDAVLASLPPWVIARIDNVVFVAERRPRYEQNPSGEPLLGLYEGVSLADRGVDYYAVTPDQITIFYDAHMALELSDDQLRSEIRTTVLHELGHHLGIDDDRLHEIGWS
jgi:predicted Zn-dependent protease with MMP-like domain